MRNAEMTLAIIEDRGKRGLRLDRVYRQLFNIDLWLWAYARLAKNKGAMTKGSTDETVDGMSMEKIRNLIESLRYERYQWTPVRRVMIPKSNGKTRPLGLPTWSDKLLQEVVRSILDAYYDPQFSPNSHGFRTFRGCHTALKNIFCSWTGTSWFIEGDIKGCFDNIDHSVLLSIIREKIDDGRLVALIDGLLKAGYLGEWDYRPTLSGTPQGGVISPLLANIYMDRLDKFVETTLIPEYTRGKLRKVNKEYDRLARKFYYLRDHGASKDTLHAVKKAWRNTACVDPMDPDYRRLRYIRYADDFLLGFSGPRNEAEEIKSRIGVFLLDQLKLELSPDKTIITHARTERARFLGYDIGVYDATRKNGLIALRVPIRKIVDKVALYEQNGKAIHRAELLNDQDYTIVSKYASEYRGIVQYYAFAQNRYWLNRVRRAMESSMLKTLASKHQLSVDKTAKKYRSTRVDRHRVLRCFEVIVERRGKKPLIAQFGGISLQTQPFLMIEDGLINTDRFVDPRSELITRILANTCEICGSHHRIQVHHVRYLSDLKRDGRKAMADWKRYMIARRRKTIVVCKPCHDDIHAGRPLNFRDTDKVLI